MENGEKLEIEEIYGSAFIDENGRLDAVMCFDGEYILLSEMQDMGLIQNCGWFSRLFKKVVKAATTVATVAVCVATAGAGVAAVIAIGAAVGTAESVATQLIETGTVCLGAVLVDTALGAIPGGTGAKTVAKESIKAGAEIVAKKATKEASEKAAKEAAEKVVKKAELGNKLEFAFGKASGNVHNVERSMQNASQLSKIGIHDNKTGREILENHFNKSFNDNASQILAEGSGRVEIYSLLSGPGGFLNVTSVWEGTKLITFWFIG